MARWGGAWLCWGSGGRSLGGVPSRHAAAQLLGCVWAEYGGAGPPVAIRAATNLFHIPAPFLPHIATPPVPSPPHHPTPPLAGSSQGEEGLLPVSTLLTFLLAYANLSHHASGLFSSAGRFLAQRIDRCSPQVRSV